MKILAVGMALSGAVLLQTSSRAAGPRVAPVPTAEWTEEQRSLAARFEPAQMPNAVATYLRHPSLAQAILPFEHYVSAESGLTARQRALLGLRTAWLTRSEYLWAHWTAEPRRAGLSGAEITRVARGPDADGWEPFERALLRAADELHVDAFVSDATWQTLAGRYNTNQLVDVVDSVATLTMHAGIINSIGIEIEAGVPGRLPVDIPVVVAATRTNVRLTGRAPRIPPLGPDEWTPEQRKRFDPKGTGQRPANVFVTFVRNPPADRVRGPINQHILNGTTLSVRQRETLLMRIGVLCRSEYEWAAHSRLGRRAGMTDADVARILAGPESGGGEPLEIALLRATDELYSNDRVSEDTWAALAGALDVKQLLDVLVAVGGYRETSMAINSAGVQLDANMADFRFPPSLR